MKKTMQYVTFYTWMLSGMTRIARGKEESMKNVVLTIEHIMDKVKLIAEKYQVDHIYLDPMPEEMQEQIVI